MMEWHRRDAAGSGRAEWHADGKGDFGCGVGPVQTEGDVRFWL